MSGVKSTRHPCCRHFGDCDEVMSRCIYLRYDDLVFIINKRKAASFFYYMDLMDVYMNLMHSHTSMSGGLHGFSFVRVT
jgi:hypothetical protein